jgi:hypothetical protein
MNATPRDGDPIETVGDFLNQLISISTHSSDKDQALAWYRGHADAEWDPVPEVMRGWYRGNKRVRADAASVEWWLNENFQREGKHLLPQAASLTDIYFLARHHGLPTRLLDWSTNALVSLFFATIGQADVPGAVHVFFPRKLRALGPVNVRDESVVRAVAQIFNEKGLADAPTASTVIPVLPDATSGRMLHQGACFTLHLPQSAEPGGAMIARSTYLKFVVPARAKKGIQRELRRTGITWAVIFPDLDNLARECRARHGLFPSGDSSVAWALDDDIL